jgi:type I restriction enzyme S subunit
MNPQTFFDHFERLADTPNAVPRLREMILQLAVQGKLVRQEERDEHASALIEKIKAEKARLIKEKQSAKAEPLPLIEAEAIPLELPKGWIVERLGNLVLDLQNGISKRKSDNGAPIPVLRLADIKVRQLSEDSLREILLTPNEITKYQVARGDILIIRVNGSAELVGRFVPCVVNRKWAYSDHLIRARIPLDLIEQRYLCLFANSHNARSHLTKKTITTAGQKTINQSGLSSLPVWLPPLEEQKRIVAKVDELMRLCDELESEQAERRAARLYLNRAALDQLLAARAALELRTRWYIVCDHFAMLTATPDLLGKLRQTVLQLAVQGKLSQHGSRDEPATSLLHRIRVEKERLLKEKHLKSVDPLPPINPNEMPFELPIGWMWVRLEELAETITKGSSPKWQGINYTDASTGILFITSENVRNYALDVSKPKYVEAKFNEIEPRSILKRKDILMNIVGASIGRTALYDLNKIANINQAVCLIRLINPEVLISLDYMLHFFNSETCVSLMFDKQVENARANLSMGNIAKFPIPFPPLEEQKRIVAAVNSLMALCDELEANLRRAEEDGERLLRAAVRSLLASVSENSGAEAASLVVQ